MVKWKTRDGRLLTPEEMETSHLEAALAMVDGRIRRHLQRVALSALIYAGSAPDGAADAAREASEECLTIMCDPEALRNEGCRLSPIANAMNKELKRRKL